MRAVAVVVAVVLLPLAFVWLSNLGDRAAGQTMSIALDGAARDAASAWRTLGPDEARLAVDGIARISGAHVRVVGADGTVLQDVQRGGLFERFAGALFFGPGEAPSIEGADAERGPVHARPETQEALATGLSRGCVAGDALLVCHAARRVTLADGSVVVVHAQDGSRRAIRALYDVRYPLIKLTLYMLVIGALLALWLGSRFVRPIETLRVQVLARKAAGGAIEPVELDRRDEIGDLARAFNELLATLELRNQANAAFMADLAHELKNPVAAVRACAEAMDGDRTLDAARAQRLSRVLSDSSRRLDALVTRFLELARAEAGLPGQSREPIALDALVHGIVETFRGDERNGTVQFEVQAAAVQVHGVPERIESAIRNLVDNAASFAGERGCVIVRLIEDGPEVVLIVADSGPGIATEDLPRVFDRFFTRRADRKGTGLGLALVRAIVEAHDGTIAVSSEPGAGATFTVRWPKVE